MKKTKILSALAILLIISFTTAYAKWAYAFVVYNKSVYVISETKVTSEQIGSVLGKVTRYSDQEGTYSGNFSNTYPRGTKYYEIIGQDVNKVIAVEEKKGSFIEANYKGEYAGGRYDILYFLPYFIGGILAIALAFWLVRRRIIKSRG